MRRIERENIEQYLLDSKFVSPADKVEVAPLPGGVSNAVFLVRRAGGTDFVLKQAREQLRVPQPWFCSVERIWREIDVLRVCEQVIARRDDAGDADNASVLRATTPAVLFEDRDNYAFAMTAAPPHHVWKSQLLDGVVDVQVAAACARLMADLHACTWRSKDVAERLGDRQFFQDLRVDPYYRRVAEVHPDLAPVVERLIASLDENLWCLVHGDFSPKNLLVYDGGVMLIDFEVGHYGDPAFDLGFFLSHLVLKTIHAMPRHPPFLQLIGAFWETYAKSLRKVLSDEELRGLSARGAKNTAGCLLARVDGKSQVDYLKETERHHVRRLARSWIADDRFVLDDLVRRIQQDHDND